MNRVLKSVGTRSYNATVAGLVALGVLGSIPAFAQFPRFQRTNLVSNDQTANPAQITDPLLKNPWGVSYAPTGPWWISNNGSGTSTLYNTNPLTNATAKLGLVVSIPGDGSITGQVFNSNTVGTPSFNSDTFLFVSEDGTVSGWRGAFGTTAQTLVPGSGANVYKGSAFGTIGTHSYLYSANFRTGAIDVLKGDIAAPTLTGAFQDPNLPVGYAPFNIQRLGSNLYVTYALQDSAKHDEVAGIGNGYVDSFDLNGNLIARVGTQGALNSPWGLAIAPSSFGGYAGDLLVGNFGDGLIGAYNLTTNSFDGLLNGLDGNPLVIDGLWALTPGNNAGSGSANNLYFTAGPQGESNGVFGSLQAVPEPGQIAFLIALGIPASGILLRRRYFKKR